MSFILSLLPKPVQQKIQTTLHPVPRPVPSLPPMPPLPDAGAPELAEAREIQRKIAASRRGNLANWLTGPTGLRAPATVAQKMLLGQ